MPKEAEVAKEESRTERISRIGRNVNVLGALAIGGLATLVPGPNVVLSSIAGLNALQAAGFELLRNYSEKHRKTKSKTNEKSAKSSQYSNSKKS